MSMHATSPTSRTASPHASLPSSRAPSRSPSLTRLWIEPATQRTGDRKWPGGTASSTSSSTMFNCFQFLIPPPRSIRATHSRWWLLRANAWGALDVVAFLFILVGLITSICVVHLLPSTHTIHSSLPSHALTLAHITLVNNHSPTALAELTRLEHVWRLQQLQTTSHSLRRSIALQPTAPIWTAKNILFSRHELRRLHSKQVESECHGVHGVFYGTTAQVLRIKAESLAATYRTSTVNDTRPIDPRPSICPQAKQINHDQYQLPFTTPISSIDRETELQTLLSTMLHLQHCSVSRFDADGSERVGHGRTHHARHIHPRTTKQQNVKIQSERRRKRNATTIFATTSHPFDDTIDLMGLPPRTSSPTARRSFQWLLTLSARLGIKRLEAIREQLVQDGYERSELTSGTSILSAWLDLPSLDEFDWPDTSVIMDTGSKHDDSPLARVAFVGDKLADRQSQVESNPTPELHLTSTPIATFENHPQATIRTGHGLSSIYSSLPEKTRLAALSEPPPPVYPVNDDSFRLSFISRWNRWTFQVKGMVEELIRQWWIVRTDEMNTQRMAYEAAIQEANTFFAEQETKTKYQPPDRWSEQYDVYASGLGQLSQSPPTIMPVRRMGEVCMLLKVNVPTESNSKASTSTDANRLNPFIVRQLRRLTPSDSESDWKKMLQRFPYEIDFAQLLNGSETLTTQDAIEGLAYPLASAALPSEGLGSSSSSSSDSFNPSHFGPDSLSLTIQSFTPIAEEVSLIQSGHDAYGKYQHRLTPYQERINREAAEHARATLTDPWHVTPEPQLNKEDFLGRIPEIQHQVPLVHVATRKSLEKYITPLAETLGMSPPEIDRFITKRWNTNDFNLYSANFVLPDDAEAWPSQATPKLKVPGMLYEIELKHDFSHFLWANEPDHRLRRSMYPKPTDVQKLMDQVALDKILHANAEAAKSSAPFTTSQSPSTSSSSTSSTTPSTFVPFMPPARPISRSLDIGTKELLFFVPFQSLMAEEERIRQDNYAAELNKKVAERADSVQIMQQAELERSGVAALAKHLDHTDPDFQQRLYDHSAAIENALTARLQQLKHKVHSESLTFYSPIWRQRGTYSKTDEEYEREEAGFERRRLQKEREDALELEKLEQQQRDAEEVARVRLWERQEVAKEQQKAYIQAGLPTPPNITAILNTTFNSAIFRRINIAKTFNSSLPLHPPIPPAIDQYESPRPLTRLQSDHFWRASFDFTHANLEVPRGVFDKPPFLPLCSASENRIVQARNKHWAAFGHDFGMGGQHTFFGRFLRANSRSDVALRSQFLMWHNAQRLGTSSSKQQLLGRTPEEIDAQLKRDDQEAKETTFENEYDIHRGYIFQTAAGGQTHITSSQFYAPYGCHFRQTESFSEVLYCLKKRYPRIHWLGDAQSRRLAQIVELRGRGDNPPVYVPSEDEEEDRRRRKPRLTQPWCDAGDEPGGASLFARRWSFTPYQTEEARAARKHENEVDIYPSFEFMLVHAIYEPTSWLPLLTDFVRSTSLPSLVILSFGEWEVGTAALFSSEFDYGLKLMIQFLTDTYIKAGIPIVYKTTNGYIDWPGQEWKVYEKRLTSDRLRLFDSIFLSRLSHAIYHHSPHPSSATALLVWDVSFWASRLGGLRQDMCPNSGYWLDAQGSIDLQLLWNMLCN